MPDAQEFKAGDIVWKMKDQYERALWLRLTEQLSCERWDAIDISRKRSNLWLVSEKQITATPRIIDVWDSPLAFAKDYFHEPDVWELIYRRDYSPVRYRDIDVCSALFAWKNRRQNVYFYTIRRLADGYSA